MPTTRSSLSSQKSSTNSTMQSSSDKTASSTKDPSIQELMDSIKTNQLAIEAITSTLNTHSSSLETNTKSLTVLTERLQLLTTAVHETLPKDFQPKLESTKFTLTDDFSSAFNSFSSKVSQDLSMFYSDTTVSFKNHTKAITQISDDITNLTTTVTSLQDRTLSKADVEDIVVAKWQDELDPHIQSHYDLKTKVTTHLNNLPSTIDTTIQAHPVIQQLLSTNTTTQGSRSTISTRTHDFSFTQPETKDFSVSKLQKELKDVNRDGDLLKDIELFWDAIQRAFTNLCRISQAYPYYCDLQVSFSFDLHFIGDPTVTRLSQNDLQQAKRNYRSFGDALRLHLRSPTTVSETKCPKAYLQLLSLSDEHDGFVLLRDLVFSLSPQLSGIFHDYRIDIAALHIQPSEHITKFYQRIIELSMEIKLANISDGCITDLGFCFIQLLRSTNCPTIIGILNPYWTLITKHHRNPHHITLPLPWTFKNIYDDLIASDITILSTPSSSTSSLVDPVAARGSAYHPTNIQNNNATTRSASTKPTKPSTQSYALHRTKDGRQFLSHNLSIMSQCPSPCKLCHNKPVNPWHTTDNCPYKHPTHIIAKDVRERIMQHNALHGAEKPGFSKSQDISHATSSPPLATGHRAIVDSDILDSTSSDHHSNSDTLSDNNLSDSIEDQLENVDEIVDTTYFDVPIPPPIVNNASTNPQQLNNNDFYSDLQPDTYITDPLQYMSYSS